MKQIKDLQLIKVPVFENGAEIGEKIGMSFEIDSMYFNFFKEEADKLRFTKDDKKCVVECDFLRFTTSVQDADLLEDKIIELT